MIDLLFERSNLAIKFDVDVLSSKSFGGAGRNRTDDGGVAVRSITTLLPRLK